VNAPSASQWTFWAATAISVPARASTALASETNGGTDDDAAFPSSRARSSRQNAGVSSGPLVHLPVAGDQHAHASGIAATPGAPCPPGARARPRRRSRPTRPRLEPELGQRPARVGAADDRVTHRARDGLATAFVPSAKRGHSKTAHRTVPEDRLRAGESLGEPLARPRPDVEAEPAVRQLVVRDDARLGIRLERLGGDDVVRQLDGEPSGLPSGAPPPSSRRSARCRPFRRGFAGRRACPRPWRPRRRGRTVARRRRAACPSSSSSRSSSSPA
jgi:hypothetical protein